jgi:hypothetical protein
MKNTAWMYLGLSLKRLTTLESVARYVKLQSYKSVFVQLAPAPAQVAITHVRKNLWIVDCAEKSEPMRVSHDWNLQELCMFIDTHSHFGLHGIKSITVTLGQMYHVSLFLLPSRMRKVWESIDTHSRFEFPHWQDIR